MSATEAKKLIERRKITSVDLISSYLNRCNQREKLVQAWAYLDSKNALFQAQECDLCQIEDIKKRPLHGLPIGIKDIFDTADMPTEFGSNSFLQNYPKKDAHLIHLLRKAGAIIMGKTVTTEFALSAPPKTCNPHALERTPGGSSSGSAAAVADFMVPIAIGSQTGGSMLRPASFCGVYGLKPSFNTISSHGMMTLAKCLDHPGIFSRCLEDLALVADIIMEPTCSLMDALKIQVTAPPRIAFIRGKPWEKTESYMEELFSGWLKILGPSVKEEILEQPFDIALDCHTKIMNTNLFYNLRETLETSPRKINPVTKARIINGRDITASEYIRALETCDLINKTANKLFRKYDALITASAPGEAPSQETTGNSVMQQIWTMLGTPAISLPMLRGPNNLPIGVQIISAKNNDNLLFTVARWIEKKLLSPS